ncbi:MAG: HlyD family efflux transporter periplasmic adaptor subunit [Bacteroidales bacterium]|nr:HlyD family efflux transporter periplasmic adaptor subunit [Bacteroidales bacterium]
MPDIINIHSEEVQEIMGRKPSWIMRWGITVLITIIVVFIVCCYFIRYPQTVSARITLTSDYPPADLVAKATGIIDSVFVSDGDKISKGQLLALIASAADYSDMVIAEKYVSGDEPYAEFSEDEFKRLQSLKLGDIQSNWIEYLSACSNFNDYRRIDQNGKKRILLSEQVEGAKAYYSKLEKQRATVVDALRYEKKSLERDSILFTRKAISQDEYEGELKNYIARKTSLAGFDAEMTNARLNRLQLEQQILELGTQQKAEENEHLRRISQARSQFRNSLAIWKEQYAIIAPYDGNVSLQNIWSRGQHISAGEIIASVSSAEDMHIKGRMKVTSIGFGKIKVGQTVNIKLSGFPYLEFGILRGKVETISSVPEMSQEGLFYTIDVTLPEGLESTYHKQFPFVQNMDGVAEIITEDMRLIEQFIRPIKSLFLN